MYQKICTRIFKIAKPRNNQNVHQQKNTYTVLYSPTEYYTAVKINDISILSISDS